MTRNQRLTDRTDPAPDGSTRHVRGSTTPAAGKMLAIGVSPVIQVLLVRSFSRSELGAFGHAPSVVSIAVLIVGRKQVDVMNTFPEIARVSLARRLLR